MSRIAAATLFAALLPGAPQTPSPGPAFEAASLKPSRPGIRQRRPGMEGGPGTTDPGRIRYTGMSLRDLILVAYRVRVFQVSSPEAGALDAKTFDLEATLPRGATDADLRAMLRSLLAARFHLSLRRERRVIPVYALTVAKGGPKLKEATCAECATAQDAFDPFQPAPPNELETDGEGYPIVPPGEGSWLVALRSGRARMHQFHASMVELASLISNQLERPIADATGLMGRYEFTLSWMAGMPPAGDSSPAGPSLPAALEQQLGLKLTASKAPIEMLVIEDFEKQPVEN
jgi:uncharacterized protein (TIGR03435 family)